jgi:hypothetical protein
MLKEYVLMTLMGQDNVQWWALVNVVTIIWLSHN